MKKNIPNLLTLMNVLAGSLAVVFALDNQWGTMALLVLGGLIFDFLDGLSARALKVQSKLGLQLDSLADMVTFGLVPGIVMYQLFTMSLGGHQGMEAGSGKDVFQLFALLPYAGFAVTLASAVRLARFNIDERQATSFIGLPTPANALLVVSLPMILLYNGNDALNNIILNPWFLIIHTVLSCYLLNAPIALFSLKFKNWGFKDNSLRYIFLFISLFCIGTMKFLSVPVIILIYLLMSLFFFRPVEQA
ncbi:CDP-alcohol phosphatidyltransferase family protein [Muriicola marianensis]|uniref:Phosphatidylserine synthase n=1 Tax=Muriicola marianensis TaxID=1324801 RepID=A0ABQ1QRR7_9FLAO|nr:CDP-alcohol phosphatidyltransferase family protein [Muriicola marianensis]GGD42762.1 phosphatidylserine synthase [Muriicola marianensis]